MIDSFPFLRYCQEEEKEDGAYRKILEIQEDKLAKAREMVSYKGERVFQYTKK